MRVVMMMLLTLAIVGCSPPLDVEAPDAPQYDYVIATYHVTVIMMGDPYVEDGCVRWIDKTFFQDPGVYPKQDMSVGDGWIRANVDTYDPAARTATATEVKRLSYRQPRRPIPCGELPE